MNNFNGNGIGGNSRHRLCGAKFGVYNGSGEKVCEGVTDAFGELCFNNLPLGTYCVKELVAPEGYYPCKEDYTVQLTGQDHDKCLTVVNRRILGSIKIIKFGA